MNPPERTYRYVGPPELQALVRPENEGTTIRSTADLDHWASTQGAAEMAEPFTFAIDTAGLLRLAPRHSEHVACAGGHHVLSAGEITFHNESGHLTATEISNQSTGYCPDTTSWPAITKALDTAGIHHPPGFTHAIVFRHCLPCRQLNIVRENNYTCAICNKELPRERNTDKTTQ